MNQKKVRKALEALIKTFNSHNLTVREMIKVIGLFTYSVGAGIGGFSQPGPDHTLLEREYYSNPTVDVALMLQGLLIQTWVDDLLQKPVLSNLANKLKEKQENGKD